MKKKGIIKLIVVIIIVGFFLNFINQEVQETKALIEIPVENK